MTTTRVTTDEPTEQPPYRGVITTWRPPRLGHALILRAAHDLDGVAYLHVKREPKSAEVRIARVKYAGAVVSAIEWRTGRESEAQRQDQEVIEARVRAEIATRGADQ